MRTFVGIDPGRSKCGLILIDLEKELVLDGIVAEAKSVMQLLHLWHEKFPFEAILLGNGTSSDYWYRAIKSLAPVILVEEQGTTFRARERYWQLWPAQNWERWIPRGLKLPPEDLDAVAAMLLVEDYFQILLGWPGLPNFRN